jgi:hypothetical protein
VPGTNHKGREVDVAGYKLHISESGSDKHKKKCISPKKPDKDKDCDDD